MRQHPLCIFVDAIHFWCLTWKMEVLGGYSVYQKKNTTTMKSFENLITFYVVSLNCSAYAETEFVLKINLIIIQLLEQVDCNWCQKIVYLVQRLSTSERDKNIQVQRNVKNCRCFVGMVNKKLCIHHLRFLLINIFYWNALKSMS